MAVFRDGQPRTLTNRANAQAECLAAPSLKGGGRAETSRNQLAAQLESRCISARADAFGFTAVRCNQRGANGRLRKVLVAINL
jgi:hypothetical protein